MLIFYVNDPPIELKAYTANSMPTRRRVKLHGQPMWAQCERVLQNYNNFEPHFRDAFSAAKLEGKLEYGKHCRQSRVRENVYVLSH